MRRISLNYRPEIDGLRGISVALVILFHAFPKVVAGGWVGVDVFFVISGYLITSLILRELDRGEFSLKQFYQRRVRRLAPALLAVLAVSAVVGWFVLPTSDMEKFGASAVAALTFWANIYFWSNTGYFDGPVLDNPLIHTWSLAVEEQFYLFYPIVVILAFKLIGRRSVKFLVPVLFLSSGLLAAFGGLGDDTVYFWFPTRAWELLAGALLAMLPAAKSANTVSRRQRLWFTVGIGGLVAILLSAWFTPGGDYNLLYSVAPVIGAVGIIRASEHSAILQRWLSFRPLLMLGLISYSAYLWHQPMLVFARSLAVEGIGVIETAGVVTFSLFLAYLTWKFVETPFRNSKKLSWGQARARIVISFLVIGALMVGLQFGALPLRAWDVIHVGVPGYIAGSENMQEESWSILNSFRPKTDAVGTPSEGSSWFSDTDPRPTLLVVGNSHSKDIFNTLYESDTGRSQFQIGRFGAQISALEDASDLYRSESYQQADFIVIASKYSPADVENLANVLERIKADGKTAVIVAGVAEVSISHPQGWVWVDKLVYDHRRDSPDVQHIQDQVNSDYFNLLTGAKPQPPDTEARRIGVATETLVLERTDYVCDDSRRLCFAVGPDLNKYYYDQHHNSLAGAAFFAGRVDAIDWLAPLLLEKPTDG
jgi:peptidoglycan/LPS O-acetylase OafA/YrhL